MQRAQHPGVPPGLCWAVKPSKTPSYAREVLIHGGCSCILGMLSCRGCSCIKRCTPWGWPWGHTGGVPHAPQLKCSDLNPPALLPFPHPRAVAGGGCCRVPPPLPPGPLLLLLLPGALPAPAPPGVIEAARRAYGQAGIPAGAPAVSWVLAESRRWGLRLPVWLPPLSPTVVQMACFWGLAGCLGVQGGSGPGFRLSVPALLPPQAPLPVLPHPRCSAPPSSSALGQPVGLMGQLQGLGTGHGVALSCMGDVPLLPPPEDGPAACCSSGHMGRSGGPP